MRLVDLLRPYLGDLHRLVDLTPPGVNIRPHLLLPDGVEYRSAASPSAFREPIGAGCMAVVLLGPDRSVSGDPDEAIAILDQLAIGGRVLLLFATQPSELPYQRLIDPLVLNRGQVRQIAVLDHAPIRAGALVEGVDRLVPPLDARGVAVASAPTNAAELLALEIRLANEWVFGDLVSSVLRDGGAGTAPAGNWQLAQERRRWRNEIAERDARIQHLEIALDRLENSGTLEIGRLLVKSGRSPREAVHLPTELLRLWRGRGR